MSARQSNVGKDVEKLTVTTEPHERYQGFDPWTGQKIDPGIPILKTVKGGSIVRKNIKYQKIKCPNCNIKARYDTESEPICPNCGLVCSGGQGKTEDNIVRDAKAAGRIEEE